MKEYYWPGNIRQLENVLLSLSMLNLNTILVAHIDEILKNQPILKEVNDQRAKLSSAVEYHLKTYFDRHGEILPPVGLYDRVIQEIEIPLIKITLKACGGNQLKCAKILGLNRNTLRKKLKLNDISVAKHKKMM